MGLAIDTGALSTVFSVQADEMNSRGGGSLAALQDEQLVARCQTGDFAAFEELVRRYRNEVYALAYHFLRNREEAWDISQEVFIKAHGAIGRFRGDSSIKTWLLRITANRCKDFFKKRRLPVTALDELTVEQPATPAQSSPSRTLEARELGEAINMALDALPDKHRTAFVLRELEGLTYEEMSQVMACNMGTVMSRLHHARKKLQRLLIKTGVAEGRS